MSGKSGASVIHSLANLTCCGSAGMEAFITDFHREEHGGINGEISPLHQTKIQSSWRCKFVRSSHMGARSG